MEDLMLFLAQATRLALPLVLAALAETVCERGGVINLGIEGMMLAGALVAYLVAAGGPPRMLLAGFGAAAAAGVLLAGVLAWFSVVRRTDQIVTGTALHFLCAGGTGLVFQRLAPAATVRTFPELPGVWPFLPYALALGAVAAAALFLGSTTAGLRLRAAGESPFALAAAGGSPVASRVLAVLVAGGLAGLAGATLTTVLTGQFVEGMSGGRGFLALSLVLFARWRPVGALAAGLFLGTAFALELHLSVFTRRDSALAEFFVFLVRVIPYLLTVLALALAGPARLRAPAALGRPLDTPETS